MGKHHHHHGGGGFRGGYPYPFPIQYPQSSEVFVVDSGPPKPAQICNPTPPIKAVPGTYRNAKGEYCWPAPGLSGVEDQATMGRAIRGVGAAYLLHRAYKKKEILSGAFGLYLLLKAVR